MTRHARCGSTESAQLKCGGKFGPFSYASSIWLGFPGYHPGIFARDGGLRPRRRLPHHGRRDGEPAAQADAQPRPQAVRGALAAGTGGRAGRAGCGLVGRRRERGGAVERAARARGKRGRRGRSDARRLGRRAAVYGAPRGVRARPGDRLCARHTTAALHWLGCRRRGVLRGAQRPVADAALARGRGSAPTHGGARRRLRCRDAHGGGGLRGR